MWLGRLLDLSTDQEAVIASGVELHLGRGWLSAERALVRRVNRNDANGYYKALGLSPDATREEIKAAYYKLIKTLHPDRGGDEELFRFVSDIARILLNPKTKIEYDSVENGFIYLGDMEREELARNGVVLDEEKQHQKEVRHADYHWTCLTSFGLSPGKDIDEWIDLCWQVSPAVGYRGKIRVGMVEGGSHSPLAPNCQWGVLVFDGFPFVVFQTGIEPNRLHALCAMIELQKHLMYQIRASAQDRKRILWP